MRVRIGGAGPGGRARALAMTTAGQESTRWKSRGTSAWKACLFSAGRYFLPPLCTTSPNREMAPPRTGACSCGRRTRSRSSSAPPRPRPLPSSSLAPHARPLQLGGGGLHPCAPCRADLDARGPPHPGTDTPACLTSGACPRASGYPLQWLQASYSVGPRFPPQWVLCGALEHGSHLSTPRHTRWGLGRRPCAGPATF